MQTMIKTFQGVIERGGEKVWPGLSLTDRPVLFHFPNGHAYGFGLVSSSPMWRRFPLESFPLIYSSQLPSPLPPLHPTYPMEGQVLFVIKMECIPENPFIPLLTFIHEYFHLHQFRHFAKDKVTEAMLSDYHDVEILTAVEVEHHLLTSFLQAKGKKMKESYLKDYIALSRYHRELVQVETLQWEDHQQKMEGLADYVSIKTFQVFHSIPNFSPEDCLLKMRKMKNPGCVNPEDALKGRHYFVGATLGYALDFCRDKNWKMKIETEGRTLQSLIEESLPLTAEESSERLLELKKGVKWRRAREDVRRKLEEERVKRDEVLKEFDGEEGVVIRLGTPSGPMSSGGRHRKSFQIDHRKAYFSDTSLSVSQDQKWTLRFDSIPMVLVESRGDRLFKLPPDMFLKVDEREISLKEILSQGEGEWRFSTLSFKHQYCELDSKRAGRLRAEGETLSLEFD